MLRLLLAVSRKIDPNPECVGFPIHEIVTIDSFAAISESIIAPKTI